MHKGVNSFAASGKAYEHHVINVLHKYYFKLNHQGGRGDGGIDLKGCWNLSSEKSMLIIAQCKLTSSLSPRIIREMEGVVSREIHFNSDKGNNTIKDNLLGLIVSNDRISDASRIALTNSQFGLIYLKINDKEHSIRDVMVSKIINDQLLPDLVVGIQKINAMEKKYNFMYKNHILSD